MNCITIVGARPQFIKAAAVSRSLRAFGVDEKLLHTGQHYDPGMSQVFFDELQIPTPHWQLQFGGGSHGAMTGAMLAGIEEILMKERPERVMVYGDTNSTLAGALAAAKLNIPVIHVEAGLRSFNRRMPEEINRIMTDHLSNTLFCSSETGRSHLVNEGIFKGVHVVGDVMRESLQWALNAVKDSDCDGGSVALDRFLLMTLHRAENTDARDRLHSIFTGIASSELPVLWPVHPRTKYLIKKEGISIPNVVNMIEPVGYLEMVRLLGKCSGVLTDSGGLQKEAYWAEKPCLTLRDETEWTETIQLGWNQLVGAADEAISKGIAELKPGIRNAEAYGSAMAATLIAEIIVNL
jgi:UDP-GlcNAc3NAcA epimerase